MKRDKQADEAAVVDMNDTLMDYAHKRQPHVDDLAEELAKRAKDNINAIDDYLKDDGEARKEYQAIATGYLRDKYDLEGDDLTAARDELVHAAIHYLVGHTKVLDDCNVNEALYSKNWRFILTSFRIKRQFLLKE